MNKKLLTLFVLMIVAAATISFVSAADTQTVNGLDFKVPDGYKYDANLSAEAAESFGIDESNTAVFTKGDDMLLITVIDNPKSLTLDDLKQDYPEKTIGDKKGFINSDEKSTLFEYIDGDKIVMIEGPTEQVVESVLK